MNNILITGITGFVGSHMADYLIKNCTANVFAITRWRSPTDNIKHLLSHPRIKLIEADLMDRSSLRRALQISTPDVIYHFASQSFPGASFKVPVKTLQTNVIGTTNLLEEVKAAKDSTGRNPRIVSVSSSEVYGMPEPSDPMPIKETNPLRAANPYSISKVGHDMMSQYYHKAFGLDIVITRMFSHEGSRRGHMFALSSFAKQIVESEIIDSKNSMNREYPINHGNLNSIRTYNHIEDAVAAYWLCASGAKSGEIYNIGGDETCTIEDALDALISMSTISDKLVKKLDPERVRPTDITLQIPCSEKFRNETGWKPVKGVKDICHDLLEYWRKVLT